MAFYFRKLGRTLRLVPTTKSFGYSTRISEGDKKEDGVCCGNQKNSQLVFRSHGESTDSTTPASRPSTSSSSLVPLSSCDMALVLMPRLSPDVEEENSDNSRHPTDKTDSFMSAAKSISFTSDDILPKSFSHSSHIDQSSILERVVFNVQHPPNLAGNDRLGLFQFDKPDCHIFQSPKSCTVQQDFEPESIYETLFMSGCDSKSPYFHGFAMCSDGGGGGGSSEKSKDGKRAEQLHSIKGGLEKLVKMMFSYRYDYSLLHKNVVFENRLFGELVVRNGQTAYALELLRLRFKIHTRFTSTHMEVLNTTVNEETGVIRIHWRLKGMPQSENLKFWRVFQERKTVSQEDWFWFEAFSYFHIGKDGLVHKHKIDRMLPGSDQPDNLSSKLREILSPAKPLVT